MLVEGFRCLVKGLRGFGSGGVGSRVEGFGEVSGV